MFFCCYRRYVEKIKYLLFSNRFAEFIQENTKKLKKQKQYILMAPEKGELACGIYGAGRMPEVKAIFKKITETIKK